MRTRSTVVRKLSAFPSTGCAKMPAPLSSAFAAPPLEMLRGGTLDAHVMAEPSYSDDMTRFQLPTDRCIVAFPQDAPASPRSITGEIICHSLISSGAGIAVVPESLVLLQGVRSSRLTRPVISRDI